MYDGSSYYYVSDGTVFSSDSLTFTYQFYSYHKLGYYDVQISNMLDGVMILENAFALMPEGNGPYITQVDPDHADRGESLWVSVTGVNTNFTMGSATLVFAQGSSTIISPNTQQVINDTVIEGEFNFDLSDPAGFYDVHVYEESGVWSVIAVEAFYLYEETAVDENFYGKPGKIYPNPASNRVYIERSAHNRKGIAIDILDMSGKKVHLTEMTASQQAIEIDISDFEKGIYLVQLRCDGDVSITKLVVR